MPSDKKRRFMNIAHRGFSARYPENTLLAFEKALDTGVKWVEFDVQLTSDGIPVVIHDSTVDRTTDGSGRVADLTLEEILRLDAGSHRGEEFAGERVPVLDEVLELLKGRANPAIELKGDGAELVRAVLEAVADGEIVTFSSFKRRNLELTKLALPEASLNPLVSRQGRSDAAVIDDALELGATTLGMEAADTTAELVRAAHGVGLLVRCWGAADDAGPEIRRLIAIGADGLTTNHPDILMRILEEEGIAPF